MDRSRKHRAWHASEIQQGGVIAIHGGAGGCSPHPENHAYRSPKRRWANIFATCNCGHGFFVGVCGDGCRDFSGNAHTRSHLFPVVARAFSSEVASGSRKETRSNRVAASFLIQSNGKGSSQRENMLRYCAPAQLCCCALRVTFIVDPMQFFRPARQFAAMYSSVTEGTNAGLSVAAVRHGASWEPRSPIHFASDIDQACASADEALHRTGTNSHEQVSCWPPALRGIPKRVILGNGDWLFCDGARDDDDDISAGRSRPPDNVRGHRGLSAQRRDGARVGLDPGAIGSHRSNVL